MNRIREIARTRAREIEYRISIRPLLSQFVHLGSIEDRNEEQQANLDGLTRELAESLIRFAGEDPLADLDRSGQFEADAILLTFNQLTDGRNLRGDANRRQDIDNLVDRLNEIRGDHTQPNIVQTMLEALRAVRDQLS